MTNKQGFTLTEILIAVMIVVVLTIMAVPLYEKTIERSRLAEARTLLVKLLDAKQQAMFNMDCTDYNTCGSKQPKIKHLPMTFVPFTSDQGNLSYFETPKNDPTSHERYFGYTLKVNTFPTGYDEGVCAKRLMGDAAGVEFLYAVSNNGASAPMLFCKDGNTAGDDTRCSTYYGETSTTSFSCIY